MAKFNTTPAAVAHFVEWLNGSAPYYYDLDRKGWTTREVNAYTTKLVEDGLVIAHPGDSYTYTIVEASAVEPLGQVPAEELSHGQQIIDPEGNVATVIRIRRVDHQRGRLETDLGVAVVDLNQKFPVLS